MIYGLKLSYVTFCSANDVSLKLSLWSYLLSLNLSQTMSKYLQSIIACDDNMHSRTISFRMKRKLDDWKFRVVLVETV